MTGRPSWLGGPERQTTAPSVEEQVRRALADRTNGWWIAEALSAFDYLEPDFGYRLDEVSLHFRGSSIRYVGRIFELHISYDPEDTGRVSAELWSREDLAADVEHPRALAVNDVLRTRDPSAVLPDTRATHVPQGDVRGALTTWATRLRELAPDVLRGEWPSDVEVMYLW